MSDWGDDISCFDSDEAYSILLFWSITEVNDDVRNLISFLWKLNLFVGHYMMELAHFFLDWELFLWTDEILTHSHYDIHLLSFWELKSFYEFNTQSIGLQGNHWGGVIRKCKFDLTHSVWYSYVLFAGNFEEKSSSIMWAQLISMQLHFGGIVAGRLVYCAHGWSIDMAPSGFIIFFFIDVDDWNFDGSD